MSDARFIVTNEYEPNLVNQMYVEFWRASELKVIIDDHTLSRIVCDHIQILA
jgi:hypothetical protein